jgi:hypothetical protein
MVMFIYGPAPGIYADNTMRKRWYAYGASYESGGGAVFAQSIDTVLAAHLSAPLLFAADFNMQDPAVSLPLTARTFGLRHALAASEPTKPNGTHPDHILASQEWRLVEHVIVATQSDHFLCWAELEPNSAI